MATSLAARVEQVARALPRDTGAQIAPMGTLRTLIMALYPQWPEAVEWVGEGLVEMDVTGEYPSWAPPLPPQIWAWITAMGGESD
jgi:hypothetical protein